MKTAAAAIAIDRPIRSKVACLGDLYGVGGMGRDSGG